MELKDELEVNGNVVMMQPMDKREICKELEEIMDRWERLGYNKPDDVPEGGDKERYRELIKALGFNVNYPPINEVGLSLNSGEKSQ